MRNGSGDLSQRPNRPSPSVVRSAVCRKGFSAHPRLSWPRKADKRA